MPSLGEQLEADFDRAAAEGTTRTPGFAEELGRSFDEIVSTVKTAAPSPGKVFLSPAGVLQSPADIAGAFAPEALSPESTAGPAGFSDISLENTVRAGTEALQGLAELPGAVALGFQASSEDRAKELGKHFDAQAEESLGEAVRLASKDPQELLAIRGGQAKFGAPPVERFPPGPEGFQFQFQETAAGTEAGSAAIPPEKREEVRNQLIQAEISNIQSLQRKKRVVTEGKETRLIELFPNLKGTKTGAVLSPILNLPASAIRDVAFLGLVGKAPQVGIPASVGLPAAMEAAGLTKSLEQVGKLAEAWVLQGRSLDEVAPFTAFVAQTAPEIIQSLPNLVPLAIPFIKKGLAVQKGKLDLGTKISDKFDPAATKKAIERRGLEVPPEVAQAAAQAARAPVPTDSSDKINTLQAVLGEARAPQIGKNSLARRLFGKVTATEADISGLTIARGLLRAAGDPSKAAQRLGKGVRKNRITGRLLRSGPGIVLRENLRIAGRLIEKAGARIGKTKLAEAIAENPEVKRAVLLLKAVNPDNVRKGLTPPQRLLDPQSAKVVAQHKGVLAFGEFVAEAGTTRLAQLMSIETAPQIGGKPVGFNARFDRVARILEKLPEAVLEVNQLTPAERVGTRGRGGFLDGSDTNAVAKRLDTYLNIHTRAVKGIRGDTPVDPLADAVAIEMKAYQSLFRDMAGPAVEGFYYFPLKGKALNAVNKKLAENRPLTETELSELNTRKAFLKDQLGDIPRGQEAIAKQARQELAKAELEKAAPKPEFTAETDIRPKIGDTPQIARAKKVEAAKRKEAAQIRQGAPKIKRASKRQEGLVEPTQRQQQLVAGTEGKTPAKPTQAEKAAFKNVPRKPSVIKRLGQPDTPAPEGPVAKPLKTIFLPEGQVAPKGLRPAKLPPDTPQPVKGAELVDSGGRPLVSEPVPEVRTGLKTPANTQRRILTPEEVSQRTAGVEKVLTDSKGIVIGRNAMITKMIRKVEQNKVPTEPEIKFLERAIRQIEKDIAKNPEKKAAHTEAVEQLRQHYRWADKGYMKRVYDPAASKAAAKLTQDMVSPLVKNMPFGAVPRINLKTFNRRMDAAQLRERGLIRKLGPEPFIVSTRQTAAIAAGKVFFNGMKTHPLVRLKGTLTPEQIIELTEGTPGKPAQWVKVPADPKIYGELADAILHNEIAQPLKHAFELTDPIRGGGPRNFSDAAGFVSMIKAVGSWKANVANFLGNIAVVNTDIGIPLASVKGVLIEGAKGLNHPKYGLELRQAGFSPFFDVKFAQRLKADPKFKALSKSLAPETDPTITKILGDGMLRAGEMMEAGLRAAGVGDVAAFINPKAMAEANRMIDLNMRQGSYIWLREKGYSRTDSQRIVNDALIDYNDPSRIVASLKGFSIGGFGNRFAQNQLSWAGRGVHMATNANPRVAARIWKWPAMIAGWNVMMQKVADLDEEELSIIERTDEVDQRGPNGWLRMYLPKDEDGNVGKLYLGRMNPWGMLTNMTTGTYNALQGANGVSLISTVLQPHLGISGAFNVARNFDDFYKSEIRPLDAPLHTKTGSRNVMEYLLNHYTPEQWGRLINNVNDIRARRGDDLLLNMRGLRLEEKELMLQEIFGMPRFRGIKRDDLLKNRALALQKIKKQINDLQTNSRVRRNLGLEDAEGEPTSESEQLTDFFVGRLQAQSDAFDNTERRTLMIQAWRAVFDDDPTVKNPLEKAKKFIAQTEKDFKEDWSIITGTAPGESDE